MLFQTCMSFFLLLNTNKDILKNFVNQTVDSTHWHHCRKKIIECIGSQWVPSTACWVAKWCQNFHFWVNYPFKGFSFFSTIPHCSVNFNSSVLARALTLRACSLRASNWMSGTLEVRGRSDHTGETTLKILICLWVFLIEICLWVMHSIAFIIV